MPTKPEQESTAPDTSVRAKLLAKVGHQYHDFDVPGVGPVRIKNLTAREQIDIANTIEDASSNLDLMVTYILRCVVDPANKPVFTEADRELIMDLDSAVIAHLSREIRDLCGLSIGVKEAAKN